MQTFDGLDAGLADVSRSLATFASWARENGRFTDWLTAVGVPFVILGGMWTFRANQRRALRQDKRQLEQRVIEWAQLEERRDRQHKEELKRIKNRQSTLAVLMLHIRIRLSMAADDLKGDDASLFDASHALLLTKHYCNIFQQFDTNELDQSDIIAPWDDFTVVLINTCHALEQAIAKLEEGPTGNIKLELEQMAEFLDNIAAHLDTLFVSVAIGMGLNDDWIEHHKTALEKRDALSVKLPDLDKTIDAAREVAMKRRAGSHLAAAEPLPAPSEI